jgi:hypothetical protein
MKKVYRVPAYTLVLAESLGDAYDAAWACLQEQEKFQAFGVSVDGIGELNVSDVTTDADIDEMFKFINIWPDSFIIDASKVLSASKSEDYDPWTQHTAREYLQGKDKPIPPSSPEGFLVPLNQLLERIDKIEKEIIKIQKQ